MKYMWIGVAGAAAMLGAPAWAGKQDFEVVNKTGYVIEQLHVAPSRQQSWEEDVLGEDVLVDGDRTEIVFDRSEDTCMWDIKVTYDDGEVAAWQGINLCKVSVVSLTYDSAGNTWAETD